MRRVAFLTSGGDCQALNATMRGVAKTLYNADPDTQIIGILEGYKGLLKISTPMENILERLIMILVIIHGEHLLTMGQQPMII